MNQGVGMSLSVSIKDLPAVHVACVECKVDVAPDKFSNQIRECFQHVQTWVRELGYDPHMLLTIGVLRVVDGQLSSYGCCVLVPETVINGSDTIGIKELVGGRYVVVRMEKEPTIIGNSIRCFHQEYVPQNNIEIDGSRPIYEVYYESTMDYCVPIVS